MVRGENYSSLSDEVRDTCARCLARVSFLHHRYTVDPPPRRGHGRLTNRPVTPKNHHASDMPSYGSNDGYGRQKLQDRPTIRLTSVGRAQNDSSQMAALLAEADIDRGDACSPEPSKRMPPAAAAPVDLSAPTQLQWFQAAKAGDVASLERLLEGDASLLTRTGRGVGHTALHWAAAGGHGAAATWLLDAGIPVDVRNAGESTPLHAAASSGQLEVVLALCRRGADATAVDDCGSMAVDVAKTRGHADVVKALAAGDVESAAIE